MRVLLTGADGFVGRHVSQALQIERHDVIRLKGNGQHASDGLLPLDIVDYAQIEKTVTEPVDVVLHMAAQSSVHQSWADPRRTISVNTLGTLNLWHWAVKHEVAHFIYISSAEVYAPDFVSQDPVTESHPVAPSNPYGVSKMTSELLLNQLNTLSPDVCLTVLRPFNHVGPGQRTTFAIPSFAKQLRDTRREKGPVVRVGNLKSIRDFLDVRDVALAYTRVVGMTTLSGVYNVCSGIPRSLRSVLNDLIQVSEIKNLEIISDADRFRPAEIPSLVGDGSQFEAATGWKPTIHWIDTIRDIWEGVLKV